MYDLGERFGGQEVPQGSNLLVTGPPLSGTEPLGFDVLAHGVGDGEGALVVTNTDGIGRLRETYPAVFDVGPVGVIDCISDGDGAANADGASLDVRFASSPDDMTGIGIEFSGLVESFFDRGITRNRVLFSSVSTLLLYSDLQTVFRFLHVFTSRVDTADAIGLYTLQPDAHDDRTMNTVSQLFDGIVRLDEDGGIETQLP